jgi:hypothetical protein
MRSDVLDIDAVSGLASAQGPGCAVSSLWAITALPMASPSSPAALAYEVHHKFDAEL